MILISLKMLNFKLLMFLALPVLCLPSTKEISCNVFSYEFEEVADRCIQSHEAVNRALWSNNANKYILNEALNPDSRHHPPTAMIIHYRVRITESENLDIPTRGHFDANGTTYNGEIISDFKRSFSVNYVSDTDDNIRCKTETDCTISIGWSSASVYTFIRPKFMLSLQPAWFLSSLNFSIHRHFGFPREITLHINIQNGDLPVNTPISKLQYPLEQVTATMKTSNVSSTYLWKPSSGGNEVTFIEVIFILIVFLSLMISAIYLCPIPYNKLDYLYEKYTSVWVGFMVQGISHFGLEISHIFLTYEESYYSFMRIAILSIQALLALLTFFIYIYFKYRKKLPCLKAAYCAIMTTFGLSLVWQIIPLIFFMAIYPIEIISTVGIVAFGVVILFAWASMGKWPTDSDMIQSTKTWCTIKCYYVLYFIINFIIYVPINVVTYLVIVLYITFLNSLQKSPDSQVIQLIFALLPPIATAIFSYFLDKWKKESPKDVDEDREDTASPI